MKHLNIDSANVLGYSLGGTVAFDLAIRHPELVKKLIIISSVFRYDGWIQSARDLFLGMDAEFLDHTPLKTEYDRLAPIKSDWKSFVNKMVAFDKISFDLGAANIKAIATPALLIMGDNDGVHLDHMAEMYRLFGGGVFGDMTGLPDSRLAILPATTHVSLMMETEKLLSIIQLFIQPARSRRPQHQK